MKKILSNNIAENVRRQPFTKASYEHIQEAFQEVFAHILKGLTAEAGGVVVLWGITDSDPDAPDFNLSAGAVLYDGEVYDVDAFVGSHVSDVPVLSLEETFRAGDPVKFSDNNEFNVHAIRKLKWTMGVSGSGIVDFSALKRFKQELGNSFSYGIKTDGTTLKTKIVEIGDWNMDTTPSVVVPHGLNFKKIRSVSGVIRNDLDTKYYTIGTEELFFLSGFAVVGFDGSGITIGKDAGAFTGSGFDATSYNRGFITIVYEA